MPGKRTPDPGRITSYNVCYTKLLRQVSIAHNGRIIRRQDPAQLVNILNAFLQGQPGELPER